MAWKGLNLMNVIGHLTPLRAMSARRDARSVAEPGGILPNYKLDNNKAHLQCPSLHFPFHNRRERKTRAMRSGYGLRESD